MFITFFLSAASNRATNTLAWSSRVSFFLALMPIIRQHRQKKKCLTELYLSIY